MEDRLSRRNCGAGSDQGQERFFEVYRSEEFMDCVLASRSVRKRVEVLQVLKSGKKGSSHLLQRESLDDIEGAVHAKEEIGKAL